MRFTKMHGLGNDYIYIYEDDVLKENRNDEYYQKLASEYNILPEEVFRRQQSFKLKMQEFRLVK